MYELAYHLNSDPFRLSPDHRFCFRHKSFVKARSYLQFALQREEGFIMISGAPGTGKTTLLDDLLSDLGQHQVVIARLVSTQLAPKDLLNMVAYEFGINVERLEKSSVLNRLEHFFKRHHLSGTRALLIIDEAQNLEPAALEEMRMLSNLQVAGQSLLQIFLVGQENLHDIVLAHNMTQFHQRLIASAHLEAMSADETASYVLHRLETAGWLQDPQISLGALRRIHIFSQGVPRRINQLCSRLLLYGAVEDRHRLDSKDVQAVIAELREEMLTPEYDIDPLAGSLDDADKINAQPIHSTLESLLPDSNIRNTGRTPESNKVTHIKAHLRSAKTPINTGIGTNTKPEQTTRHIPLNETLSSTAHLVASEEDHLINDDNSARENSTQGNLLAFLGFLLVLGMIAGISIDLSDDHWQHMIKRQPGLIIPVSSAINSSMLPLTAPSITKPGGTTRNEPEHHAAKLDASADTITPGNLPLIREMLQEKLSDGVAQISDNTESGIRLQLTENTNFDLDSARLKPTLQAILARLALLIKDRPELNIHITGHSDSSGPALRNKKLSATRSHLAAAYLARLGIPSQRISHQGRDNKEILSITTPELNRRIELHLNPSSP